MSSFAPRRRLLGSRSSSAIAVACGLMAAGCGGNGSAPAPPSVAEPAPPTPIVERIAIPPADPIPAAPAPATYRRDDYEHALERSIAWLDRLRFDLDRLRERDVDAVKKYSEILWAYQILHRHLDDPVRRAAIEARVAELAEVASGPSYHRLETEPEEEFRANNMSYFLVARTLHEFGHDVTPHLEEIVRALPRLDADMATRGVWQRAVFAEYYDWFRLPRPAALERIGVDRSDPFVRRTPFASLTIPAGYVLTHHAFAAFDYGQRRIPAGLTPSDRTYLTQVFRPFVNECIRQRNPDLLAEVLSCLIYLDAGNTPEAREALDFLLSRQNEDATEGTWGDYEILRLSYGDAVDHQMYLHTVQVVLRALMDAYEGGWPTSPAYE